MNSSAFYNALVKRPSERNDEDVLTIFNHLRRLDVFERLHDAPLRSVCRTARLERHPSNYVLFRKGQLATCWYILLSGSVFMNKQVYLPIGCFGKRSNMNLRRMSDCIVISPSDMIVIDYPDVQRITVQLNNAPNGNMASNQQPSTSTAFPAGHSLHQPQIPSALASSSQNSLPFDSSGAFRKQNVNNIAANHQRIPPYSPPKQRQPQPQQNILFHRFPTAHPNPLPSSHFPHPHRGPPPPHQVQQIPISSATISHRVPSPAPISSASFQQPTATLRSSPTKSLHCHPPNSLQSCHSSTNNNNNNRNHHTKSNSMSESTNAAGLLSQQQQSFGRQFGLHSHEIEVPFVRAKGPQQQIATAARNHQMQPQIMQRQMAVEQQQQMPQEHFSPPRPPRIYVRPISSSTNSLVHQKKSIFEANSVEPNNNNSATMPSRNNKANHHSEQIEEEIDEEGEEMGTMKRRDHLEGEGATGNNSSTLTRQNADKSGKNAIGNEKEATSEESAMTMPPPNSNFQRLSKIRLNLSGKKNMQPASSNSQNASTTSQSVTVIAPHQMMANVRIRQQSPQNRLANGHSSGANKIRQSTASSISGMTADESDCFAGLPETAVDSEGPEGDDEDKEEEDDEEGSCPSHDSFQELRDSVRECLEKDPSQRGAEDLAVLIEFMASLPALAALPMAIKRQLCEKMVFALVPQKGTVIMQNGERIDAWSVVVNGFVEHLHSNGHRVEYRVGDCFGVQPIGQAQFNDGEIKTMADDCEFVLVEHGDFYAIMSTLSRHVERENDDNSGEIVREVERRMVDNQVELVITKASPDRLLRQLLIDDELLASAGVAADAAQMDSHFVEDFLLMHRVFFTDSAVIVRQMIDWFQTEPKHRDRVARIMLIWMNNHFEDFESKNDPTGKMTSLLNEFDDLLGDSKMYNHQSLLSITCSVKSQPRQTTLTRSDRSESLDFQLIGSSSQGGIYIACVNPNSAAEKNGLKRGDEILEVNSHDFRKMSLAKAEDLMRESTHLSITLKTNWIGFKEAIAQDQVDAGPVFRPNANAGPAQLAAMPTRYQKKSSAPMMGTANHHFQGQQPQRERRSTLSAALNQSELHPNSHQHHQKAGSATPTGSGAHGGGAVSSKKVLNKLLHMIRGSSNGSTQATMDEIVAHQQQQMADSVDEMALPSLSVGGGGTLRASRSNPDISAHSLIATSGIGSCSSAASSSCSSSTHRQSSLCTNGNAGIIQADQVLKVYRSDQSFRYIPICGETTAKQLVHLALQEFGIPMEMDGGGGNDCCWWALYECSVSREGVIKQRRLPDTANNLTERVGLNGRLYLRDLQKGENTLLPDELIPDVLKQARLTLYTLNAQCIATQLTLQDFGVFAAIEPTEYVNHLFQLVDDENPCSERRCKGWPKLAEFEDLFNKEMWWVATEVCCERNVYRRSKLVKKFIKIARHCHMLRNLNSMFAIVSGLEKPAVRRLAHTWERVPGKYLKMLADLQQLMDPSRNMSRYRQHLAQLAQEPPLIPIYPILRKDLTFAHEANATFCGPRLVNFEKLRMIAQIIRSIQRFSSVHYDPMELLVGAASGGMVYQPDLLEPGTIRKGGTLMAGIVASRFGGGGSSGGSMGGGLSRKKLFERTLMLKRVKAYLQSMPIIDSEVELDRISLECEPPALSSMQSSSVQQLHNQQQSGSSTSTARRRLPSPSPSSLSSQSNQSSSILHHAQQRLPKFGVESPQAVQKMLSLVQNSKIKPRPHHPIGRSQLHQSHGALSASAELPPISNDQRKRTSLASTSSSKTEEGATATERAI